MDDSPIYGDKEETRQSVISRRCKCGDGAPIWTAWSDENPGRRFTGCPNYKDPRKYCHYFAWIDPQLPEASKRIILAKYLRSKIEVLDAMVKKLSNEVEQSKMEIEDMTEKAEKWKTKFARKNDQNNALKIEISKRKEREKFYIIIIGMLLVVLAITFGLNNTGGNNGRNRLLKP